jgi:hypothetical protein
MRHDVRLSFQQCELVLSLYCLASLWSPYTPLWPLESDLVTEGDIGEPFRYDCLRALLAGMPPLLNHKAHDHEF